MTLPRPTTLGEHLAHVADQDVLPFALGWLCCSIRVLSDAPGTHIEIIEEVRRLQVEVDELVARLYLGSSSQLAPAGR